MMDQESTWEKMTFGRSGYHAGHLGKRIMHVVDGNSMRHMMGDCVRIESGVKFGRSPNLVRLEFEL